MISHTQLNLDMTQKHRNLSPAKAFLRHSLSLIKQNKPRLTVSQLTIPLFAFAYWVQITGTQKRRSLIFTLVRTLIIKRRSVLWAHCYIRMHDLQLTSCSPVCAMRLHTVLFWPSGTWQIHSDTGRCELSRCSRLMTSKSFSHPHPPRPAGDLEFCFEILWNSI